VEVRPSPIHGVGVFARTEFSAGDIITREDDSYVVTEGHPLPEGEEEYGCDWYADGRQIFLPAPERHYNHACDPNALVRFINGVRHTVARRYIAAGEEITHDYCIDGFGDHVWQCNCGGPECRETIHSDFFHLPRKLQIEYLPYLSDLYKRVYKDKVDSLMKDAGLS
jgi:hypothetical protein